MKGTKKEMKATNPSQTWRHISPHLRIVGPVEFSESPVSKWFQTNFATPTPPQREAWPRILSGKDVLVASPTGTGKTFAAFFAVLDRLALEHAQGRLTQTVRCIYVSPLRALGYDLEKNLQEPLREI